MALRGCPFCREIFVEGEAERCPECGVELLPVEKLPLSYEARVEIEAELAATPPEHRPLPWWYVRRGRGALLLVALVGLGAFFAPWVVMSKPEIVSLSGYDLARLRAGWFWGGAIGWFVMLPLVASRRTLAGLRGVRVITATFALMTSVEVGMLLVVTPRMQRLYPLDYEWGWGLYASAVASLVGVVAAARLGGRLDDIELPASPASGAVEGVSESSDGQVLH